MIATSDNGCSPAAGTDELEAQGHFPSARFRGYKSDIWDGGHRVPFLVRWPGRVPAGSECSQLICHNDLMATCAEIVGASLPANAGEDSVSFLPALLEKEPGATRDSVVHHSINGRFAIRQGTWKLELCPGSGGWSKPKDAAAKKQGLPDVQLYDLSTDLGETKNLQAEHPEVVDRLKTLLKQQITEGRSTPGKRQRNDVKVSADIAELKQIFPGAMPSSAWACAAPPEASTRTQALLHRREGWSWVPCPRPRGHARHLPRPRPELRPSSTAARDGPGCHALVRVGMRGTSRGPDPNSHRRVGTGEHF